MLCLAGNEEVVEAAPRSQPLRPHKTFAQFRNKQQGREVIHSGGSHFLCRAPETRGEKTPETAEKRLHHPTVSICFHRSEKFFCQSLTVSSDISSYLISSLTFICCCDFASSPKSLQQTAESRPHSSGERTHQGSPCFRRHF